MMRKTKPFMFDYSFDDGADDARKAKEDAALRAQKEAADRAPPTFTVEELAAARTEAEALGRQQGMSDAMASIDQQVARTLDAVMTRLPRVFEEHANWTKAMEADAVRLSSAIMHKLAPELTREKALPEVESVIQEAFGFLTEQPKVMIRVASQLEDALADKVNLMASRIGYEGQVVLVGDPELQEDDCRVSWQAGAVERSLNETWQQIDDLVERALNNAPVRDHGEAPVEDDPASAPEAELDAEAETETEVTSETSDTPEGSDGDEDAEPKMPRSEPAHAE